MISPLRTCFHDSYFLQGNFSQVFNLEASDVESEESYNRDG